MYLELEDNQYPKTEITHDRVVVRAVVYDEEGNLYFARINRDDDFGKATLIETAGGGVEPNEEMTEAIRRELHEELGVDVIVECEIGIISDYYNLIKRHNINHYYLCKVISFEKPHLTDYEMNLVHLSTLKLTYEEAILEYNKCACYPLGKLLRNRELPILEKAQKLILERKTDGNV